MGWRDMYQWWCMVGGAGVCPGGRGGTCGRGLRHGVVDARGRGFVGIVNECRILVRSRAP